VKFSSDLLMNVFRIAPSIQDIAFGLLQGISQQWFDMFRVMLPAFCNFKAKDYFFLSINCERHFYIIPSGFFCANRIIITEMLDRETIESTAIVDIHPEHR
jgi:hypothetical protein